MSIFTPAFLNQYGVWLLIGLAIIVFSYTGLFVFKAKLGKLSDILIDNLSIALMLVWLVFELLTYTHPSIFKYYWMDTFLKCGLLIFVCILTLIFFVNILRFRADPENYKAAFSGFSVLMLLWFLD